MDINERLVALESVVESHTKELDELREVLKIMKAKNLASATPQATALASKDDEFEALKVLLESNQWPAAVESYLICNNNSEQDKQDRAEGILDLIIDVHLEKLGFLDFGCGEGHVVNRTMIQNPRMSVGYDIAESETWSKWKPDPRMLFTSSWDDVVKNGPYNVVLAYDVLDHIEGDNEIAVIDTLKKIKSIMAPNAKLFARCHPWCSRHGTHLYHQINKAYAHLVFTPQELEQLGYKGMWTRKIIHPLMTYMSWFQKAGLRFQRKEQVVKSDIEKFFTQTPLVAKRIKANWKDSPDKELREGRKFPFQLEFQFADFVLI